jgi:endonuclease/exonuclease/phosphatase family metal-dependent hydrolase
MMRTRNAVSNFWVLILLIAVVLIPLTAAGQDNGKAVVKVMTYNVNEGTDFLEVLSATNLPDFLIAVQVTLDNIDSTNPPLRMQAVAREIAQTQPDLVGLQEVTTWTVGGQVRYDMLQELLSALHDLGEDYVPVVVVDEFQLAAPLPDVVTIVQCVDHDVILARAASEIDLSNIQQGHFSVLLPVPTAAGTLTIVRGWGSVDVTAHGQSFRFIVSHLENYVAAAPVTLLIQEAQAAELALGPGGTTLPVIIAADTNADALGNDPTIATYQLIRNFGFGEAWGTVHPDQPGATWGFMPDPNDPRSTIYQRIDYVFFNDGIRALTSQRAGVREQEKVDDLWPSDHTGVRATFQVGSD